MKLKIISLLTISAIFFLAACKKNNDSSNANFKLKTTERSATVGRTAGTITWTSGFASATEIEFEAKKDNIELELKSEARQRINLFSPLSTLGLVTIPPGIYKEVEFEIHISPAAPDAALELRGTYNSTPIVFRVNTPIEIEAEFDDVTITQGNDFSAIISLNLSLLTLGITDAALSNAMLTNGEIIISATSNIALYNIMLANLKNIDDVEIED